MDQEEIINKTMDLDDLRSDEALKIIDELNGLIVSLQKKDLKISSWYGNFSLTGDPDSIEWKNRGYGYKHIEGAVDDKYFPWFLYWQIVWVVLNNNFHKNLHVLDLGGSSSLFSYYLASKGVKVTTIDLQKELVDNANFVAKKQDWDLINYVMDMRKLDFRSKFDHITSICVFEHLPMYDRVAINRKIKDLLVEDGKFSITFDYRNPVRSAQINSKKDIYKQFIKPSGLRVRGNAEFLDNGKKYLLYPYFWGKRLWKYKVKISRGLKFPHSMKIMTKDTNDYTFGALFLEK
jgi:2-polyprenyl-3-methyl-5-hydroxy-6-metoxy-1,4-benzoquinol methylase